MKINPKLTPGRIRVLEFLEKNPGQMVTHCGKARFYVMRLGWTDWARNDRGVIIGEQLTDQGRAILSAHRLAQIPKPQRATPPVASMQRSGIEGDQP